MTWLEQALAEDPEGGICAFCGGLNENVDDCGFFYLWPDGKDGKNGPACEGCERGEMGKKHRARYGVGER